MKIGVISFFMMESSIPLVKHLSSIGNQVDLYSLLPHGNQDAFVFDFINNKQKNGFTRVDILDGILEGRLLKYLARVKMRIFIFPDRWFQKIVFLDFYKAYLFAKVIGKQKYDVVHIIHTSDRFWLFLFLFLNKKKIVQTLHEVTSHEAETSWYTKFILRLLIKHSIPVIFHSEISKVRFLEFKQSNNLLKHQQDLNVIRFGLFETYKLYKSEIPTVPPEKIGILNFGRIVPYKGINILIEAVKLLQSKYPIHLIVAGSGAPYFNFEGVSSYEFINRSIPNEEVVSLIKNCDMVVLPYISGSQSGIPMTVFAFNKAIIASDVAGFKEVIDDHKTGLLVENLNAKSLAFSIEELIIKKDLEQSMPKNIQSKYNQGEFAWTSIAEKTLTFYNNSISQN